MVIRKLESSEAEFLKEMFYLSIYVPKGSQPYPESIILKPELSKYYENWNRDSYDIALIAETDNISTGLVWGRMFDENNPGYGFIDKNTPEIAIAVKENFRNQGTGTALIEEISRYYLNSGVKNLSLSVSRNNPARSLYERTGFRIIKENEVDYIMIKTM